MESTRGVGDWIGGEGKKGNGDGEEKKEGSLTLDGGFEMTEEAKAKAKTKANSKAGSRLRSAY
jgi:hypothetical protein